MKHPTVHPQKEFSEWTLQTILLLNDENTYTQLYSQIQIQLSM